jgi:CheY-specific phosphatase CheX
MDILSEILNSISSAYAAELSQEHLLIDLVPPQVYLEMQQITTEEMLVLPLVVKYETFYLLINMARMIEIH